MRSLYSLVIHIALACLLAGSVQAEEHRAADTPDVSLVSLIATPEKYDGKYVRIRGVAYFDSKYYINAVFLTREDKRRANSSNAIFVRFARSIGSADHLNDKFVLLQGTFRVADKGHLGVFGATLTEVDRVEAVKVNIR